MRKCILDADRTVLIMLKEVISVSTLPSLILFIDVTLKGMFSPDISIENIALQNDVVQMM